MNGFTYSEQLNNADSNVNLSWIHYLQIYSTSNRLCALTPLESCLVNIFPLPTSCFPNPPSDACLDSGPPDALFHTGSESDLLSEDTFLRGTLPGWEEESWAGVVRLYEKPDGKESETGRRDSPERDKVKIHAHKWIFLSSRLVI